MGEKTEKRIFSEKLLNELDEILLKGGKIYFKTDHLDYYYHVLNILESNDKYKIIYHCDDLYSTNKVQENIKTEFEHLFLYRKIKQ